MILEAIVSSFFSGLGSTVFQELIKPAKKNEAQLRVLIRQEWEAFACSSPSVPPVIDDTPINAIVRRLKAGDISTYPAYPAWQNDAAIYKITSLLSEKVLDVWGASSENGVPIKQHAYHGGTNQHWRLIPVSSAG
jgi:Ricin-type beta-trefoil lectin domain-like